MAYANPSIPYELYVGASREGLGGMLYQERDSHAAEKNLTYTLEFLALKWAVVDKLKELLYGTEFVVKTDNNPLTYVLTPVKMDAMGHQWLMVSATV